MIENFRFNDIILYCKGWYQTPEGDTIIDDLSYLFEKIYAWTPNNEEEVAKLMLRVLDKLQDESCIKFDPWSGVNNFTGFYDGVKRNMQLYHCSFDMAIIWFVYAILQGLSEDEIKLNRPVYGKKEHFRMGNLFSRHPISMTYKEMNNRAIKAFND